jgi:hypothetical protein
MDILGSGYKRAEGPSRPIYKDKKRDSLCNEPVGLHTHACVQTHIYIFGYMIMDLAMLNSSDHLQ